MESDNQKELEVIIVDCDSVEGLLFSEWVKSFNTLFGTLTTIQQNNIWNRAVRDYLTMAEVVEPYEALTDLYTLEAISEPQAVIQENRVWLFRTKLIKRKPGRPKKTD